MVRSSCFPLHIWLEVGKISHFRDSEILWHLTTNRPEFLSAFYITLSECHPFALISEGHQSISKVKPNFDIPRIIKGELPCSCFSESVPVFLLKEWDRERLDASIVEHKQVPGENSQLNKLIAQSKNITQSTQTGGRISFPIQLPDHHNLPQCFENQKLQELTYKMVKNQKVLCESGEFPERASHSGNWKNTGFGSSQWTKADSMFKIKLSFLLENHGINEECLEEKE